MKLKYYLRGLGIGIIVTTILLMIAFALHKPTMSDADIIARAKQLGMVMPDAAMHTGGGESGGRIVAAGTPQQIKQNQNSITGKYM